MTACTQPGCTGRIVDDYCDVCGSPAGAAQFVPAGSAASSGIPLRPNNPLMLACTQQGCTGMIVDGYCDVCGSPEGAAPFVPAGSAASAASPAPADEPGLPAVPASTPRASGPVNDTILDLPWSTKTTDWIDIEESREVEATLRRLIEPAVADVEEADAAEVEPAVADLVEADAAEVEPAAADVEEGDTAEVELAVADLVEGDTAEVEPAVADMEEADSGPAGPHDDDTAPMPAVGAVLSAGRHPGPQLPEQQVHGPVPVQNPADKKRFGFLALAAIALAALLIGALLFAASRDGGVTARSVATVTATATMTVSKSPSERSDESADTVRGESSIQLEDLAASAKPFEAVRIQGTYRGGANTFLRVQRWEEGKWLDFPLPTKTDQSGQFITQAEFGQPGRYRLRVLDPDSDVASKPFVVVIKG
jgi:hypothetical protein